MQPFSFINTPSFSVFQNTSHRETNFLSKQLYFLSSIDYIKMRAATWSIYFFAESFFSKYLLVWSSYFFLITTPRYQILFLISYFLKINTFSAQRLFRRRFLSRKSNYSEHALFRGRCFFWTVWFWNSPRANNVLIATMDMLEMWLFRFLGNCGIFKQASENSPNEFRSTCDLKDVAMTIC